MPDGISEVVQGHIAQWVNNTHGRHRSWEHCYGFFADRAHVKKNIDLACLSLGFYLASWGMYRGSSFLLQKDYLVHKKVIQKLTCKKYEKLRAYKWPIARDQIQKERKKAIKLLFELNNWIRKEGYKGNYKKRVNKPRLEQKNQNLELNSEILSTKIIMGVFGCAPAYDIFFRKGLKEKGISCVSSRGCYFNETNFLALLEFLDANRNKFKKAQKEISKISKIRYPPMKVVDMYFWEIGKKVTVRKKNKNGLSRT